jgi:hypothetical protein
VCYTERKVVSIFMEEYAYIHRLEFVDIQEFTSSTHLTYENGERLKIVERFYGRLAI